MVWLLLTFDPTETGGGVIFDYMYHQRTIKKDIYCRSVGLHSGRKVSMVIRPADADTGIVFRRSDLPGDVRVKASLENVSDTTLATTIGLNGTAVSTIEHLMSAMSGMGVDNAIVEVSAPEVPIMDGSALPFVQSLKEVGTNVQDRCKKILVVTRPVTVTDGYRRASLLPCPCFRITYTISFTHPSIGDQTFEMTFSDEAYERDICSARTFGFLKDVEYLQARGLALGGSLKNAIVLDDHRIINKEGLRFPDEFVKHKILDAIGDLSLLGMPIIGHFVANRSGHRLNNRLLKELLLHEDAYRIVTKFPEHETNERLEIPSFRILDSVMAS